MHYFTLDKESLDNITRKPNLTLDIPRSGYNFRATNRKSRENRLWDLS